MSSEQSLAGAMGCASWRSHRRLREHAALAPVGGAIQGSKSLKLANTEVLGLNEVGVTDLVMATIWRFGPRAAAYAVSPGAEANHLGADIAILHSPTSRILLYQAKLASLHSDGMFNLKSKVTGSQIRLLNRRRVVLQETGFQVTGRLALYQADATPFIHRCPTSRMPVEWWEAWWWRGGWWDPAQNGSAWEPEIGRQYYQDVLAGCGCSPSGIVAAPVPRRREPVSSIALSSTWPWEFDTYEWFRGTSPLDGRGPHDGRLAVGESAPGFESAPDFEGYIPTAGQAPAPESALEMASQLAEQLQLPASKRLYLVVLA